MLKHKDAGEAAASAGNWPGAIASYTSAVELDASARWQREILPKLASAQLKAGAREAAKATAQRAIALDDGIAEAHHTLAEVAMAAESWDEAVREAKRAHEIDRGNGAFQDTMQRAEAAQRQSLTKDYYKILGAWRGGCRVWGLGAPARARNPPAPFYTPRPLPHPLPSAQACLATRTLRTSRRRTASLH
jgi:tetratricopeptide (TPR) repeat protein